MAYQYKGHYDIQERLKDMADSTGQPASFLFIMSSDRGPGKTFSVCRMLIENFLENGEKFILFRRYSRELGSSAQGIFKGYFTAIHPTWYMKETIKKKGGYSIVSLYKGEEEKPVDVGYVLPLNMMTDIRNGSSEFVDATWGFFDEFQPKLKREYLPNEFDIFYDVYKSVARGGKAGEEGKAVRPFRVVFVSNTIDIDDPYLYAFGLSSKIQDDTMLYRGNRVIYERVEVEGLKQMHAESDIDVACESYLRKKGNNLWLNTDSSLVAKPDSWGHGTYIATLELYGEKLGLLYYSQAGFWYISRKTEKNCKNIYNMTLKDGATLNPVLKSVTLFRQLHDALYAGRVRVHDTMIQSMLLEVFH